MRCNPIFILLILLLIFIIIKNSVIIGKNKVIENYEVGQNYRDLVDSQFKDISGKIQANIQDAKFEKLEYSKMDIPGKTKQINNIIKNVPKFKTKLPNVIDKFNKIENSYCNYDMNKNVEQTMNDDDTPDINELNATLSAGKSAKFTNKLSLNSCGEICNNTDNCYYFL